MKRKLLPNESKKTKQSSFEKYQKRVCAKLTEIGFKKSVVTKIATKEALKSYYNDFADVDTIKAIIVIPEQSVKDFCEYLMKCGVRKTKARYWDTFVDVDSYTFLQRLHFIIEYAIAGYKPTTANKFLFKPEIVEDWYKYEDYDFYNASTIEECENVYISVEKQLEDSKLYYHATSFGGAKRILELGPKNGVGRECLDFGSTSSFYTTPSINTAKDYAKRLKRWYGEVCIIAFRIRKCELESFEFANFPSATRNWMELTADSRKCVSNMLDHCEFVYGPMVANPEQVCSGKQKPKTHNPAKFQLASKKDSSDKYLYQNIHSFVWIRKNIRKDKWKNRKNYAKQEISTLFCYDNVLKK